MRHTRNNASPRSRFTRMPRMHATDTKHRALVLREYEFVAISYTTIKDSILLRQVIPKHKVCYTPYSIRVSL